MIGSRAIDPAELQKHSTEESCWIVVHKKVWDITEYLSSHPGGQGIILRYAGNDATEAYNEIHAPGIIDSNLAADKLKGYIKNEHLMLLPKIEGSTASPDQLSLVAKDNASPEQFSKPPLAAILNTHDFEHVASKTTSPKGWAFYSSAATDLITHQFNTNIYSRIFFRPRILRPIQDVDLASSILGIPSSLPVFVSPAAMARLAHFDGELALARGAKAEGILQCISTNASYPLKDIVDSVSSQESPRPWFLQLYVNRDRKQTEALLARAVKLGVSAVFLTVDCPVVGKREADERLAHDTSIRAPNSGGGSSKIADSKGGGSARMTGSYIDANLKWDDIPWIADSLARGQKAAGKSSAGRIPIVIKGIQVAADARQALKYADYGVKGVYLSNHGGRSLDTSPPAILTLLECWKVCPEIFGLLEVYVDGGIKRGTDVVKAIALGATAVGLGRPFLYSLTYGEEGVRRLIDIFRDEIKVTLQMLGVTSISQLHPGTINTRDIDHLVPDKNEDGNGELRHPYAGLRIAKPKL